MKELEGMREFFDAIHEYFRPRTLCITFARQIDGSRPEINYATAFIMFFGDLPMLVTAGHACEAICEWQEARTLVSVELNYAQSKFNDEVFSLNPDEIDMYWWDSEHDLDIGIMLLSDQLLERFLAFGISAVNRDAVAAPSNQSDKVRMAIGFSADGCKESDEVAFYVLSNGRETPIMNTRVAGLGRRIVAMNGFTERRNSQFVAFPIRDGETSMVGMSGGIVVEFDGGKAIREYRIVGIQSGQASLDDNGGRTRIKRIYINDAVLACEQIETALEKMKDKHRASME